MTVPFGPTMTAPSGPTWRHRDGSMWPHFRRHREERARSGVGPSQADIPFPMIGVGPLQGVIVGPTQAVLTRVPALRRLSVACWSCSTRPVIPATSTYSKCGRSAGPG